MALLHEALDEKKLDVRLVEKNLMRNVISNDDVQSQLKKLPDDAESAEWISLDTIASSDEKKK